MIVLTIDDERYAAGADHSTGRMSLPQPRGTTTLRSRYRGVIAMRRATQALLAVHRCRRDRDRPCAPRSLAAPPSSAVVHSTQPHRASTGSSQPSSPATALRSCGASLPSRPRSGRSTFWPQRSWSAALPGCSRSPYRDRPTRSTPQCWSIELALPMALVLPQFLGCRNPPESKRFSIRYRLHSGRPWSPQSHPTLPP